MDRTNGSIKTSVPDNSALQNVCGTQNRALQLITLPEDVLWEIMSHLNGDDIITMSQTNSRFYFIANRYKLRLKIVMKIDRTSINDEKSDVIKYVMRSTHTQYLNVHISDVHSFTRQYLNLWMKLGSQIRVLIIEKCTLNYTWLTLFKNAINLERLYFKCCSIKRNNWNVLHHLRYNNLKELRIDRPYKLSNKFFKFIDVSTPNLTKFHFYNLKSCFINRNELDNRHKLMEMLTNKRNKLKELAIEYDKDNLIADISNMNAMRLVVFNYKYCNAVPDLLLIRFLLQQLNIQQLALGITSKSIYAVICANMTELIHLDLYCNIKSDIESEIDMKQIDNLKNLKVFKLESHNSLTLTQFPEMSNSNLQELYLWLDKTIITEKITKQLVASYSNLKVLFLRNCDYNGLSHIFNNLLKLVKLQIYGSPYETYHSTSLEGVSKLQHMEHLELNFIKTVLTDIEFADICLPRLKVFIFNFEISRVSEAKVDNLIKSCPNIETLSLYKFIYITDACIKNVTENLVYLKKLNISYCEKLTKLSLDHIKQYSPQLREITVVHPLLVYSKKKFASMTRLKINNY